MQQVEPAVEVVVEEEDAELERQPARRADAGGDRLVGVERGVALRHVERRHLVGEVADRERQLVVVAVVGAVDAHGAGGVAVGS